MTDEKNIKLSAKIVILGDSGVGKSCLIYRYCSGGKPLNPSPTCGVAYNSKIVSIDNYWIELRIWDTAGQETYHSLTPIYVRNSKLAYIVFDITERKSFENIKMWIKQLREFADDGVVIVIVGNKIDLLTQRTIESSEIINFCRENKLPFVETSAITGFGVDRMLQTGIAALIENSPSFRHQLTVVQTKVNKDTNLNIKNNSNKNCC